MNTIKTLTLFLGVLLFAPHLHAGPRGDILDRPPLFDWMGLGAGAGTNRSTSLTSYHFFATTRPLYSWRLGDSSTVDLRFTGTAGLLDEDREQAFMTSLGPLLDVTISESRLHFIVSSCPAYLGDETFGRLDLGSHFQFISSAGFDWHFSEDWIFGYRWQHISNAGISDVNPGLNLNTIRVGFRF